ncbi:hypothetical protein AB3X52_04800 [Nocardioides sp. DS6]|uniref:MFS transporter n=1 Tax=Nocardioides eburneus TaxID=3231482 RepID=A0ABV3SX47_9ACTN
MAAPTHAVPEARPNELVPYAAAGLVGAALVIVLGNTNVDAGEDGGLGPALITGVGCVVLAALLFALVLRRFSGTRTQIVLMVLTILSLVVFWSGATPVLGAAAAAAARRPSGSFTVAGWVAIAAAAIAVVWSVVAHFM